MADGWDDIVKGVLIIPKKAHRNGNARFTIFTKDDEIQIKWLKSKFSHG